jgi:hypothetical protein
MALSILDGNQSATTLSTILSSGQHITAHTVVSLGTQAITDMRSAVSGSVVSISNLPSTQTIAGTVTVGNSITINYLPTISGVQDGDGNIFGLQRDFPISGTVAIGSALPAGTNRIGVVTIGAGTVTIGAGTAQIGSVTASISNSITIASLPALVAGIAQIGSVTASISGTVPISISSVTVGNSVTIGSLPAISGTVTANTFALQGTAVTTSNFTSTTASTVLANYNATREVLTIFNEGAGNLFVSVGATCTTVQYQVRLSSGDYYEVPNHQTTITHSAVFATAGTARVCQVS